MSNLFDLSSAQLIRAAAIKEKISALENELVSILGSPAPAAKPVVAPKKKRTMNAAGRARIKAAQKARWAKIKQSAPVKLDAKAPAPVAKKKFKMSAAAKAKISAAAKARWAKIKGEKKA
jgi:hypothetical protein